MKLPKYFGKPKRLKPLFVRRVVGKSMLPVLPGGQLVLASCVFGKVEPGQIVVIRHNGLEKIKRVQKIDGQRVFVIGDNFPSSTDSRSFGWLQAENITGKIIWPKV